jgi:hypothetical protein
MNCLDSENKYPEMDRNPNIVMKSSAVKKVAIERWGKLMYGHAAQGESSRCCDDVEMRQRAAIFNTCSILSF